MMFLYLYLIGSRSSTTWEILCAVVVLCLLSSTADSNYFGDNQFHPVFTNDPPIAYKYDRQEEVQKECKSVLAAASDLKPDDNRSYRIKNELSFVNGDWEQSPGKSPLLPFANVSQNGSRSFNYTPAVFMTLHSPLKLASFWITDVDGQKGSKSYISVSGVLNMGITSDLDGSFYEQPYERHPFFRMWPGRSEISILFQGIYLESGQNMGERVLCLLGDAMLPSREHGSFDDQPSILQDDQIVLVIYYPKTLSLTDMVIRGDLKSLNTKGSPKYFDDAHIISHLSFSLSSNYAFSNLVTKACNGDSCIAAGTDVYKQADFCSFLEQLTRGEAFTVVPNWKCNGTDEYCSRLGPFLGDKEINATDGSFKGVGLFMQDVRCEQTTSKAGVTSAKVLAIIRAASRSRNRYYASTRSGLNNMTVAAEGIWSSTSGQLCMIACLGIVSSEADCNSRACLYIPLSFSIKQRSILVGSFSSLSSSPKPYFPLSFEKLVHPRALWQLQNTKFQYKYSKIGEAGTVLEKDQPFSFGNVIKKSLMTFPKLENGASSLLSEDLSFHTSAVPDPVSGTRSPRIDIQMEILSLGDEFGPAGESQTVSIFDEDNPNPTKTEYTEREILLNVSAQLTVSIKAYSNLSVIFLEGLYDPHVGKMYMIGCRDVRASWIILYESMDLEAGLDCQIEVVVSYPPTTARWFTNPTAKVSVSSQRNEDDPLHFHELKLQTLPFLYRTQREDILSHRGIEGVLRILTLTMTVCFVLSQLIYMRQSSDSVPFISLVMLGVQVLGYSLHLVTGAESIFRKSSSYDNSPYAVEKNNWVKLVDYCVKLLVLVLFLLTLRICQRVWKSRVRLLSCAPLEPRRVPSDRTVMIIIFVIHMVGYITALFIHNSNSGQKQLRSARYIDQGGNAHQTRDWETQLEEYVGLVQDFFLLPQIIGNLIWQIQCKPLRKLYYIGITAVRVLPHAYDYFRDPIPNPYFVDNSEFVDPAFDFYSKSSDIFIPVIAVILTIIVFIQKTWSYEKIGETLTIGQFRLLPSASRSYQPLPSKTSEAELVSGIGNNLNHRERHDNEE